MAGGVRRGTRVAAVSADDLRVEATWVDAEQVASADLRATWCELQVWLGDRCVTSVRGRQGGPRDQVFGSAYPLAEWIAFNWWSLLAEQRPTAVPEEFWSWRAVQEHQWLRRHNTRAANEGQAWPDLTLVREGGLFSAVWNADIGGDPAPVRFLTSGKAFPRADQVVAELERFVQHVLDRLASQDVLDTPLAKEWQRVQDTARSSGEESFCRAAARLGLDPYDLPDAVADRLPLLKAEVGGDLLDDFLDSADPTKLDRALAWLQGARSGLPQARTAPLSDLRAAVQDGPAVDVNQPWFAGYEAARLVRRHIGVPDTDLVSVGRWVHLAHRQADSSGLGGYGATLADDTCSLLVPAALGQNRERFASARALGRALFQPVRSEFLLTATRATHESVARSFAAELLAPAAGVEQMIRALDGADEAAYDAIASRYEVSPLVIRLQAQNQLG